MRPGSLFFPDQIFIVMKHFFFFWVGVVFLCKPELACAIEPSNVLVIANRFVPGSVDIARYYMDKRGIPEDNLLEITTTENESCLRVDYDYEIAAPVRKVVAKNKNIQVLVTVYGVPLKVGKPPLSSYEEEQLYRLKEKKQHLELKLKELSEKETIEGKKLKEQLDSVLKHIKELGKEDYSAAVDSELALVRVGEYDLKFWLSNPLFLGNRGKILRLWQEDVLLVSRLDGPSQEIVKRIIDDSLSAEKTGLAGIAYFDAKGKRADKVKLRGISFYDNSLHLAADRVKSKRKSIPVVIDEKGSLFQSGEAPYAALYCGWYSYSRYIDAFDWAPGAIGYHISSVECSTLRPGKSQVWCKRMLEDGVAAVIGPVAEPYVQAFPVPEAFFSLLTEGSYNLVESYFFSLPHLSWRMVLVGDPLYKPFRSAKR